MNRTTVICIICTVALGISAAPAAAQSPTADGYSPTQMQLPNVATDSAVAASTPSTATEANDTTNVSNLKRLPFTGIDVRLIVLGGITLLGTGFAMRRFAQPRTD